MESSGLYIRAGVPRNSGTVLEVVDSELAARLKRLLDERTEANLLRQVIAYGHAGDVLLALSTSGNSVNVIDALAEARRRKLLTVAMVGYDGGRVRAEGLIVTRSQHIPRIQEAQASAYHVLRELVG